MLLDGLQSSREVKQIRLMHASESEQCGWCKDRYGLSWQIIPKNVGELLKRPNAFANMMKMHKLEIAKF